MRTTAPERADDRADVVALTPPLRRFVASLVRDSHDVDDVVQETLARVLPHSERLDEAALTGYSFTVARNVVRDLHRSEQRRQRLLPRLHETVLPEQPDAAAIAAEERRALRSALDQLPPEQRELMLAHDLHDQPLAGSGTSSGAAAARLTRARARARVDYALAMRRLELPTPRCKPVLLALSAGDRRRQTALRAGSHLVSCRVCASVAPALLKRDRTLVGLLPWWPAGGVLAWLAAAARRRPVQLAAATSAVAAGTVLMVALWPAAAPAPPPEPPAKQPVVSELMVGQTPLLPLRDDLAQVAGRTVTAQDAQVLAVPADEGFWVGRGAQRVWVQLVGSGESKATVRPGQTISFTGRVVAHPQDFPALVGVSSGEGARELTQQGFHVEVARRALR